MHRTFILTIPRNIDRAKKILPWTLNSEIVFGLDAKNEENILAIAHVRSNTKSYLSHVRRDKESELVLSDGEVACTLGHKKILEKFLNTEAEYCVVLEDDVEPTPLLAQLEQDLSEVFDGEEGPSIFVLGGQEGLKNNKYIDWKSSFKKIGSGTVHDLTASSAFVFRTCCYAINRGAAKRVVDYYEECLIVADDYLRIAQNTGVKIVFKRQGYYSHPIGGPSELQSSRIGINRITRNQFYKLTGIFLIFLYNSIDQIKPSFYQWVLHTVLFEKD